MNKNEEIQEFILTNIKNNIYTEGMQIPTEMELMERFLVSRMTVNKALGVLRNKGIIYSIRGKGTFVKKEMVFKKLNKLTSFTEEMHSKGIEPITRTLEIAFTSVGFEEEKKSLNLAPEANVYKIVRVRYLEECPIALDITVLNPEVIGDIEISKMGTSLYEFLQDEVGIQINYAKQRIRAIKAEKYLSIHLEIPEDDPVLKITSVTYDGLDRPFEVVHTYYVHDAYEFEQISTK